MGLERTVTKSRMHRQVLSQVCVKNNKNYEEVANNPLLWYT